MRSKATWRQRSKGPSTGIITTSTWYQIRGKYQVTDTYSLSIIGTSGLSCPADEEESGDYIKCDEGWRQGSIISSSVYPLLEQRQTDMRRSQKISSDDMSNIISNCLEPFSFLIFEFSFEATSAPFLTSVDVCPGIQSQRVDSLRCKLCHLHNCSKSLVGQHGRSISFPHYSSRSSRRSLKDDTSQPSFVTFKN